MDSRPPVIAMGRAMLMITLEQIIQLLEMRNLVAMGEAVPWQQDKLGGVLRTIIRHLGSDRIVVCCLTFFQSFKRSHSHLFAACCMHVKVV